jgi:hypothetical protein
MWEHRLRADRAKTEAAEAGEKEVPKKKESADEFLRFFSRSLSLLLYLLMRATGNWRRRAKRTRCG